MTIASCRGAETGTANVTNEPPARSAEPVRVGFLPLVSYAPFMIAKDEGYFDASNIEVELVPMRHNEAYTALAGGDVDVYAGPLNPGFFNLMARGARVRIVADKGFVDPDQPCAPYTLLVRKGAIEDGVVPSAAALRGLTYSYSRYTQWEYVIEKYLAKHGIALDEVREDKIPSDLLQEAFAQGKVDVAIGAEPIQTQIFTAGVARELASFGSLIPDAQMSVIFYGRRLLDDRPDLGRRFLAAYLRGVRTYAEGPTDRNLAIIARYTGLEVSLLRKTCWTPLRVDGSIDFASTDDFVRWAASRHYIDRVVDRAEYWDPRFLRSAPSTTD